MVVRHRRKIKRNRENGSEEEEIASSNEREILPKAEQLDHDANPINGNDDDDDDELQNTEHHSNVTNAAADNDTDVHHHHHKQQQQKVVVLLPQFRVAKWAILRGMALVYAFCFAAAYHQNVGLMGVDNNGLQPVVSMQHAFSTLSSWQGFWQYPTLFWWIPLTDQTMNAVAATGLALSLVALIGEVNSWLLQLLLWLLYFSIVTPASIATSFYAYGWESQILETGFLCIFLCALPHYHYNHRQRQRRWHWALYESNRMAAPPDNSAVQRPSAINLWLFQWLMFRITTGAGLIKVRGSSCWTAKTCLYYHFETQPLPSPLSFAYHFLPHSIHRRMVDTDLVVQLYTAWFVLFPSCTAEWFGSGKISRGGAVVERVVRLLVRTGGFLQAGFMVGIAASGNFSVLNHLTIIPALACLDDACWPAFLRQRLLQPHQKHETTLARRGQEKAQQKNGADTQKEDDRVTFITIQDDGDDKMPISRRVIEALLLCLILFLSRPVIDNLLQIGGTGRRQLMNASFDSFRIVNTHGAFGSVGKARYEPIIGVSADGHNWTELNLPCKPGDVYRRPCFVAPYHYRLDWNIWFIGFKPHSAYLRRRETWLFSLVRKLLEPNGGGKTRERPWLDLLDPSSAEFLQKTYYQKGLAPVYVKVDMYRYRMAAPLWTILYEKLRFFFSYDENRSDRVPWWTRQFEENLIPPRTLPLRNTN